MAELTDEQVFGRSNGGALTDAQVFGSGAAPKELSDAEVFSSRPGLLQYPVEFGKRVVQGAIENTASALRGAGARGETGPSRELESAIAQAQQGVFPGVEAPLQTRPAEPVSQSPLYQAGESLSKGTEQLLQPDKTVLNPVVGDIASGLGSVGGNILTSLIPGAGPLTAFNISGAGAGEAAERAVKGKATPEQQAQSGLLGNIAGLTDFVDTLLPELGTTGKALGLMKRVGVKALYGAFTEGGQEGLQQFIQNAIAKGVYKPGQDLTEDVAYNAFIGAVVGGMAGGATVGRGGNREDISPEGLQAAARIIQRAPAEAATPAPVGVVPPTEGAPAEAVTSGGGVTPPIVTPPVTEAPTAPEASIAPPVVPKPQSEPTAPPEYGDATFIGRNGAGHSVFERPDGRRIVDEPSSVFLENVLTPERNPRYITEGDIQRQTFGTDGTTVPMAAESVPDHTQVLTGGPSVDSTLEPSVVIPAGTFAQSLPDDVSFFPSAVPISQARTVTPVHSSYLSAWMDKVRPSNPDPIHSAIFDIMRQRVARVAPDVMVHVLGDEEFNRTLGLPPTSTAGGVFVTPRDPKFRPVILIPLRTIRDQERAPRVILHEGIHAASSAMLRADPKFRESVRSLMEETKAKIETKAGPSEVSSWTFVGTSVPGSVPKEAAYGFISEEEFLAEAFTRPGFQHILANIRASQELTSKLGLEGKKLTLWQSFIQLVRRALGLQSNLETYSMLEAVLRIGSRVIDAQARFPGDPARPDRAPYVQGIVENQRVHDSESKGIPAVGFQPELSGLRDAMSMLFSGNVPQGTRQQAAHADRMNWVYKWFAGLDQLAVANPNFAPLILYKNNVQEMHLEESLLDDMALRIGKDWRRLRAEGDRVANFFNELVNMSYRSPQEVAQGISRHPSAQEREALLTKHKITRKASAEPGARTGEALIEKVEFLMDNFLNLVAENAVAGARRSVMEVGAQTKAVAAISEQLKAIKSRPYFPFMRFGSHYVMVKDSAGNLVHFETMERQGVRSAQMVQASRVKELSSKLTPGDRVESGILPEAVGPLVGMPPMLLENMKQKMLMTPEQLSALPMLQLAQQLGSVPILNPKYQRKYFVPSYSVQVPGYSMDFKRAFAKYFFHGAKFYTKTKYLSGLEDIVASTEAIPDNKANEIARYMRDHLNNTVKDTRGDFGIFKAGIFIWAMGYVPAAATQNLSQTPMITFPYLAAKFGGIGLGDVRAARAMTKALVNFKNFYKRGYYDTQSAFEMKAIAYGIKTGRISETQAPELAGMSQANNLLLGIGGNAAQRGWLQFQEKAAWMFEMAEQVNRRIAFRAALDLAMKHPSTKFINEAVKANQQEFDQLVKEGNSVAEARAIITASHVVEQTQYTYSRWARPRFMRGRLPGTLFVFKKYMQSTLFMLANNRSDVLPRYLLIAAFVGGLGNLPGMEDLRGILKALAAWMFGKNFDIEREARKYILQFSDGKVDPDLILHGMARRGMGVGALLDLAGSFATGRPGRGLAAPKHTAGVPSGFAQNIPFPVLDRSKALGMGLISPVDIGALATPTNSLDKTIADQTQKASGAVFSVGFNIYKAIMDNHLAASDWKRWERAVPRELGAMSKSWRAFSEGRERSKGGPNAGSTIVGYDPNDTEQMMEALALSMGYQPLRVQARWDSIMAKVEVEKFYDLQRKGLLEQLFEAHQGKNPKEIEDVIRSIREFNQGLPEEARGKKITPDTATKSLTAQARGKVSREAGIPTQKSNIPLSKEIDRLFPESTVDVRRAR